VPLSEMPAHQEPASPPVAAVVDDGIDLDISAPVDLSDEPPQPAATAPAAFSSTFDLPPLSQPAAPAPNDDLSLDFDLPLEGSAPADSRSAPAASSAGPSSGPVEFDLSGINLDLGDGDMPHAGGQVVDDD